MMREVSGPIAAPCTFRHEGRKETFAAGEIGNSQHARSGHCAFFFHLNADAIIDAVNSLMHWWHHGASQSVRYVGYPIQTTKAFGPALRGRPFAVLLLGGLSYGLERLPV